MVILLLYMRDTTKLATLHRTLLPNDHFGINTDQPSGMDALTN